MSMQTDEFELGAEKSDGEHVQHCRNGQPEDFRFLVRRYQGVLFSFLVSRLRGDQSLAEDAAQESMLRAFTQLRKLKKPESFQAWLFGIAGHVAHEFQRSASRRQELAEEDLMLAAEPSRSAEELPLEEAIAALPEIHRRMILLRYYEGLSCQEVAGRLGMPLGTVTKTLSRAYAQLRQILQNNNEEAAVEEKTI